MSKTPAHAMRIYIPTYNRVGKQVTYAALTQKLRDNTVLVVDHKERNAHGDAPVLALPPKCSTIGKVRQFIIDQHDVKKYGPKLIMLDDDLSFYARRQDDTRKFVAASAKDVDKAFALVEKTLNKYAHVGIRHREMAQDAPLLDEATRALRALAYDVNVLREHNVRFDRLVVMEDFDVTLQLLRLGYPNAVLSTYIQNQGSSNAPGGCSTYRTMEKQAEGANKLARLHSPFVKVVQKETKTAWNGQARTDVVVYWKKAFVSACQKDLTW